MSQQATPSRSLLRWTADARFASWARHAPIGTPIYRPPAGQGNFSFNATTRDGTGTPVANCDVYLFLANSNTPVTRTVSDGFGRFTFDNPGPGPFFIAAFDGNNPVGTTWNLAYPDPKPVGANSTFSTTFPLTENPISQGGIWRRGLAEGLDWTDPATGLASDGLTSIAYGTQTQHAPPPYDDSLACLSGYNASHWCQGTIYNDGAIVGLPEVELLLHWTIGANSATGYEVDILGDGRVDLTRWNGASGDYLIVVAPTTNNVSIANGAVWYAEANDLTKIITVTCNGNTCYTYDYSGDAAALQSGNPGFGFYIENTTPPETTQANRHFAWKLFRAGNL